MTLYTQDTTVLKFKAAIFAEKKKLDNCCRETKTITTNISGFHWFINFDSDVFYHRFGNGPGIPGHTTRALP